jgi:hypothetical protein
MNQRLFLSLLMVAYGRGPDQKALKLDQRLPLELFFEPNDYSGGRGDR